MPLVSQDTFDQNLNHSSESLPSSNSREEPSSSISPSHDLSSDHLQPDLSAASSGGSSLEDNSTNTELKAEAKFLDESIIPDDSSALSSSEELPAQPRNRFPSFPSVPTSVHSFNPNRPPFLLDPTSGTLDKNPFPLPGQSPILANPTHTRVRYNPHQSFSPSLINSMVSSNEGSIDRKDSPVSPGNMLPMAPVSNVNRIKDMAISPNIPPKPGTLGGPGFFSPPPTNGNGQRNYNRVHLNQLTAIWQNRQQNLQQQQGLGQGQGHILPPKMGPPAHQMIGPVAPQSQHPQLKHQQIPQQQQHQQPMGPIHHTSKIYSSASAAVPTHIAPPQIPVSQHQPIGHVGQSEQHIPNLHMQQPLNQPQQPSKLFVGPTLNPNNHLPPMMVYGKASELTTKVPIGIAVPLTIPTVVQPQYQSTTTSTSTTQVPPTPEKTVLDMVMSAATAWNSLLNEVNLWTI